MSGGDYPDYPGCSCCRVAVPFTPHLTHGVPPQGVVDHAYVVNPDQTRELTMHSLLRRIEDLERRIASKLDGDN